MPTTSTPSSELIAAASQHEARREMTTVDFTKGWSKDHICRFWKHPHTLIRIQHSTLSGYHFLFDTRGGQRSHWFFQRIRDAKAAVQEVMDGPDGSVNR